MSIKLPSRYEDLDIAFRARLRPNKDLLEIIKTTIKSISMMGGLRFIPIYGLSGSGKTSASLEISTHLPNTETINVSRSEIENLDLLKEKILKTKKSIPTIYVIDQFEEVSANKERIPGEIIELLSIMDRKDEIKGRIIIVLWLTTDEEFRNSLVEKTSRNTRILVTPDFNIVGPDKGDWSSIIMETFREHNSDQQLENYEILESDIEDIAESTDTIGDAITKTGQELFSYLSTEHDLSQYKVVMLWPVTDGLRITRVTQFSDPRLSYIIDWSSWYKQLNQTDKQQLPVKEYNRTRLYFDMRIIPIAVADIEPLCAKPDVEDYEIPRTYLERFENTHFVKILRGRFNDDTYAPLRERESQRSKDAKEWYENNTKNPTFIGKRIASALNMLGFTASYEKTLESKYGQVRADIFVDGENVKYIIELKCFATENTMPSTISEQIRVTMRRHAQYAGFLMRQ
jgi:hypothetical protein